MIVRIDKRFERDTDKVTDRSLLGRIADCIQTVEHATHISSIPHLKKLKGVANYYRIKLGDYRLGVIIRRNVVAFIRCLHRKDIYRQFP